MIPWDEWVGVIEPYYPKGKRGRLPMGIEKMLRMYLFQICLICLILQLMTLSMTVMQDRACIPNYQVPIRL